VLRSNSNPQSLVPIARNVIRTLDPYLPVDNVSTLEQVVARSLSHQRLNVILLGIFAAVALILAAVGIYSLMAHGVRQRTREIGIRLALGARSYQILKMVVGQGLRLTALGIVIGVVAALFLTRLINSMLYGVSAIDPLVFAGSPLLLAFVALVATYLPARKATRVDPMIAMRNE
ncbi:MAG TPA: FtsX-like permease family protein, partial [Pyrinomonadaceae bacterium]